MEKCQEFKVFSLRIADALAAQGFHPKRKELNLKNNKLTVFVYDNTPLLRSAFDQIQKRGK